MPVAEAPDGRRVSPRIKATVSFDPLTAAGGSRLPTGSWELVVRINGLGIERTTRAEVVGGPSAGRAACAARHAATRGGRRLRRRGPVRARRRPAQPDALLGRGPAQAPGDLGRSNRPRAARGRRVGRRRNTRRGRCSLAAEREVELPAVGVPRLGSRRGAHRRGGVEPSDAPASLGIAARRPRSARHRHRPGHAGRGRITVANVRPEPWRDRAGPAARRQVRRAYQALPEPAKRVARRARRVAGSIIRRVRGRPRRSR